MDDASIISLFDKDQILVRAMDEPSLRKNDGKLAYDFSVWAEEVDIAQNDKLTAVSTTLLVSGEKIPTYKNMGFLIDSNKTEVVHVADSDSGSMGDTSDGTFQANATDLSSLPELAARTRAEKLREMNEVNINLKEDALVGLFVNKCPSDRPKAMILLAQEYYKQQTGKELPIFTYDIYKGQLQLWDIKDEEKKAFLNEMQEKKKIHSSVIGYELDNAYSHERKYINAAQTYPAQATETKPRTTDRLKELRGLCPAAKAPYKPAAIDHVDMKTLKYARTSNSVNQ